LRKVGNGAEDPDAINAPDDEPEYAAPGPVGPIPHAVRHLMHRLYLKVVERAFSINQVTFVLDLLHDTSAGGLLLPDVRAHVPQHGDRLCALMYATFTHTRSTPLVSENGELTVHFRDPLSTARQLLMVPTLTSRMLLPDQLLRKFAMLSLHGFMFDHALAAIETGAEHHGATLFVHPGCLLHAGADGDDATPGAPCVHPCEPVHAMPAHAVNARMLRSERANECDGGAPAR